MAKQRLHGAVLVTLIIHTLITPAGSQRNILYICEHPRVKLSSEMVLVAPGYSHNPGLVAANCTTDVVVPPGQRVVVKVYQKFAIQNCDDNFIKFSDGNVSTSKCGYIPSYRHVYTTTSSTLRIWYKSSSSRDRVALSLKAIGCVLTDVVQGADYSIIDGKFDQYTSTYSSRLSCYDGYLIEGTKDTSISLICKHSVRESLYYWQSDHRYRCVAAVCPAPSQTFNGRVKISSLNVGAEATHECNTGYVLEGQAIQECVLRSGMGTFWDGFIPTCQVVDCGLAYIPHANVTHPQLVTTYTAEVFFSCYDGYHILPEETTTGIAICEATGQWKYDDCQAQPSCSELILTNAGYLLREISPRLVEVSCSGQDDWISLQCYTNGTWSRQLPFCTDGQRAEEISLGRENLMVIGVCVAVTLLIVFIIVTVIILLLRRKKPKTVRKNITLTSPPNRPIESGYLSVDAEPNNGISSLEIAPEKITSPMRPSASPSDLYSQVSKLREPVRTSQRPVDRRGRLADPVHLISNDLYASGPHDF